jgi:hypothetical protein
MNMNSNLACRLACLVAGFVCIPVGQAAANKPVASPPSPEAHVFGGPSSAAYNTTDARANVIPLAGEWRFELYRKNVGVAEEWFNKELSRTIRLPGTVSTRNLGDPITGIRQQIWGGKNWKPVAEGTRPSSDQTRKVMLKKPVTARFFKLESLREVGQRPWTSLAEFDLVPE